MKRHIGTFHKTGTVLFGSILRQARATGVLVPWLMHETKAPPDWDICFDYHSRILLAGFEPDEGKARYVISIRDPRDVIISAAYYHCRAAEPWLHQPSAEFGGQTYQEKILSYPDMQDRFRFEMEHISKEEIEGMLQVPLDAKSLHVTRFETLVVDYNLKEFDRIFSFLAFESQTRAALVDIAFQNSLFSGQVNRPSHVRRGSARQWLTEFTPATLRRYEALFGDAAARLGY